MRTTIAAATMAASLTVGGIAGVAVISPTLSGAQTDDTEAVDPETSERPRLESWVNDAVQPLVPGTLDQGQAEVLDLTPEELREQLVAGTTLAEVADAQRVDQAVVVDAIVASITDHLEDAVDAGRLTQEQADEKLAQVETRAQELLERSFDGEGPRGRFGQGAHGRGGPFGPGAGPAGDTDGS